MLVYLHQLYALVIVWISGHCQGCNTGWFGEKCEFLCHCLSSETCAINGTCPNNGPCKQGFFGPSCQYVDVLHLNASAAPDQYLRDGNDTTCNPQPDATVVAVNLTEPVPFTWLRVALKDKKYLLNFTTTLNGTLSCRNERKFPVNDTLVDVSCDRGTMMTSLKISGPAAGSICSIYISGGRNVALNQATNQSSNYRAVSRRKSRASNAVDGNTDNDYDSFHCARMNSTPLPAWWSLRFSKPQIIHKVVIYNRGGGYEVRLRKFYITTFDKDNKKIHVHDYSKLYDTARLKYEVNISTAQPIASFKVTKSLDFSETEDERDMTLCEVQAFGDPECPMGTYGFYCKKKCECNVIEACNPFSGVCGRGCLPGFYGLNCSSRCGEHCSSDGCEFQSGNCLQCTHGYYGLNCSSRCGKHCSSDGCEFESGNCLQCTPGYLGAKCDKSCDSGRYGPTCSLNCSTHCSDVCNNTDGECVCKTEFTGPLCTECETALYGSNCEHNCSDLCIDRLCNKLTGECLTCVGSRIGPFCQDCPKQLFGPLCGSKCNVHCVNGTCDQVSGKCFGCEEGYEGDHCWKIREQEINWLLFWPLLIASFLLICCCKRGAVEDQQMENPDIF